MAPALTPALALDYVRELSADVRAAAVLDADGALMAGPNELPGPARDLMAAAPQAREIVAAVDGGVVYLARSETHAIVVVCSSLALDGLALHDLRTALTDLAAGDAAPV